MKERPLLERSSAVRELRLKRSTVLILVYFPPLMGKDYVNEITMTRVCWVCMRLRIQFQFYNHMNDIRENFRGHYNVVYTTTLPQITRWTQEPVEQAICAN
jgi:hypothetical protein